MGVVVDKVVVEEVEVGGYVRAVGGLELSCWL